MPSHRFPSMKQNCTDYAAVNKRYSTGLLYLLSTTPIGCTVAKILLTDGI